ncbi:hypothetical protein ABVT39_007989 [Epinephelus coioides]
MRALNCIQSTNREQAVFRVQTISEILHQEYPKLQSLNASWLFYKAAGGSGRRRLTIISPQVEGYTTSQLKKASNGGKNTLYIDPLQSELDVTPLAKNASEFSKMPKATCENCQETMPLHLLALHVDCCTDKVNDSEDCNSDVYPIHSLKMHASLCGESIHDVSDYAAVPPPQSTAASTSAGTSEGNGPVTKVFDGQSDHLVPANSAVMVESELFLMAGRMMGHCFLYGGPGVPGLSPAIKHVLCGGPIETATVTIEDCPDVDICETSWHPLDLRTPFIIRYKQCGIVNFMSATMASNSSSVI